MNKLKQKQTQFFNESELTALNFFINTNKSSFKVVTATNAKKINSLFIENLTLLKSRNHSFALYKKLIAIYDNVNLEFANKYLNGFLEFNQVTFDEYLNLSN